MDKEFAIRCPHCLNWRDWDCDPGELALQSEDEFQRILIELNKHPETYSHPKLLRCDRPLRECPAPIEACICKNENDAARFLRGARAWSLKRDFRLFKKDRRTRWDSYVGILFSTLPVKRNRHVELEQLMDRMMLSSTILGIGEELQGPFTVFGAQVFEWTAGKQRRDFVYWTPVEGYKTHESPVPPRYNRFCTVCRKTLRKGLIAEFEARDPKPDNCPHGPPLGQGTTCAGRAAACMKKDWGHCPAFLDVLAENCPCHQSDTALINKVSAAWLQGAPVEQHTVGQCWAGFTEIAFPIVVHNLLVGVAMTGQLVVRPEDLPTVQELVDKHPLLTGLRPSLETLREILIGRQKPRSVEPEEVYTARFRVDEKELARRIRVACRSALLIEEVAQAHYHRLRSRSERVFKQELLGRIQIHQHDPLFFRRPLLDILTRMREFWAFKGVYLLFGPPKSADLCIVGFSKMDGDESAFGLPGERIGRIRLQGQLLRPQPWYFDTQDKVQTRTAVALELLPLFDKAATDPNLEIPEARYYLVVLVPIADMYFGFLFAGRDPWGISPLQSLYRDEISLIAQEEILETCAEVTHKLGDVWHYQQERERVYAELMRETSHRIGNQVSVVSTLVTVLRQKKKGDKRFWDEWGEDIDAMLRRLNSASSVLTQYKKLVGMVPLDRRWWDTGTLIRQTMLGILPATAWSDVRVSEDAKKILVDRGLMEEVISELAINAVHYGGERVRIGIQVTREHPADQELAGVPPRAWYAQIVFQDDGPGLPEEVIRRLSGVVWPRAEQQGGLGLVTVRRVVEAHEGSISVDPSQTRACVVIRLPQSGEPS